jgi:outer membrane protein TolC
LSVEAELAFDYYQLRSLDAEKRLLDTTIAAYQQQLELTRVRFQTGIVSDEDVAQAETQLKTTQAQATDLGIARAQLEHAIAMLTGQPASTFSLPCTVGCTAARDSGWSAVATARTSSRHRRRGRRVAEANAEIGVTKAAFFPSLTLSATRDSRARRSRAGSLAGAFLFTWTNVESNAL